MSTDFPLDLLESLEELELYLDEDVAIVHTLSVKIQMLQFISYAIPFSFTYHLSFLFHFCSFS